MNIIPIMFTQTSRVSYTMAHPGAHRQCAVGETVIDYNGITPISVVAVSVKYTGRVSPVTLCVSEQL